MPLQGDALEDFIRTYEIAFNEHLTAAEANEMYARLLHLYRSIRKVPESYADEAEEGAAPLPPIE